MMERALAPEGTPITGEVDLEGPTFDEEKEKRRVNQLPCESMGRASPTRRAPEPEAQRGCMLECGFL